MFGSWHATDPDCCQHIRCDGTRYEMVQCVWLDMTEADRANGAHEYCIVNTIIDLNDYSDEEKEMYVSTYWHTLASVREEYVDEESVNMIIAECILEEDILSDAYVIDVADSFDEAQEKIMKIMFGGKYGVYSKNG